MGISKTDIASRIKRNLSRLYQPQLGEPGDAFIQAMAVILDVEAPPAVVTTDKGFLSDLEVAKLQLTILQAEGFFADLWGEEYFKLPRFGGESDEAYMKRVIDEALRIRVSVPGILAIMSRFFKDLILREWGKTGFVISGNSAGDPGSYFGSSVFGTGGLPEDWRTPWMIPDFIRGAYAELFVKPVSRAEFTFNIGPPVDSSGDDIHTGLGVPISQGDPNWHGYRGHVTDKSKSGSDALVNIDGGWFLTTTSALSSVDSNEKVLSTLNRNRAAGVRFQIRTDRDVDESLIFRLGVASGFKFDFANQRLLVYIDDTLVAIVERNSPLDPKLRIAGSQLAETLDAGDPLEAVKLGRDSTIAEGKALIFSRITTTGSTRLMEIRANGDLVIESTDIGGGSPPVINTVLGVTSKSGGFVVETSTAIEMLLNSDAAVAAPDELHLSLVKSSGDLDLAGVLLENETLI